MKTREILSADEVEAAAAIKLMKIKELERHAEKILKKLGLHDYPTILRDMVKLVPQLDMASGTAFKTVQTMFEQKVDMIESDEFSIQNYIERLSVIMIVLVAKKFDKIHQKK